MKITVSPTGHQDEFVVGQDDIANLVIRPANDGGPYRYFYDQSKSRLVKAFILGTTPQTMTQCRVTLVDRSAGKLSPRFELSVRSRTKAAIKSIDEPVTVGETRTITARVDLNKHHESFWKLIGFLGSFPEVERPAGDYKVVPQADADLLNTMTTPLIDALKDGTLPASTSVDLLRAMLAQPDAVTAIANAGAGAALRTVVQRAELSQVIDGLQILVDDPTTTEPDLQKLLEKHWWIFGGRFVDEAHRRSLTVLDQLDIPLIQADGSLHVIELKQAAIKKLVAPHRNHHVVGQDINTAVGQAANYLLSLDEKRAQILTDFGVDVRRARATVVIGHPRHCHGIDDAVVRETVRNFNSHLTRIEVLTYEDLLAGATQVMKMATPPKAPNPDLSVVGWGGC